MGRRRYTGAGLRRAVRAYFDGITRTVPVTEKVWHGEYDSKGNRVYDDEPVTNSLGTLVEREEYLLPPSVGALCRHLGISRETWSQWKDAERFPEFQATIREARDRLQAWNEQEMLVREGKDLKGILFNLQNNYGYTEKKDVRVGGRVEDFLRETEGGAEM